MAVPSDDRDRRPAPSDDSQRPAHVGDATVTVKQKEDGRLLLLYGWPA